MRNVLKIFICWMLMQNTVSVTKGQLSCKKFQKTYRIENGLYRDTSGALLSDNFLLFERKFFVFKTKFRNINIDSGLVSGETYYYKKLRVKKQIIYTRSPKEYRISQELDFDKDGVLTRLVQHVSDDSLLGFVYFENSTSIHRQWTERVINGARYRTNYLYSKPHAEHTGHLVRISSFRNDTIYGCAQKFSATREFSRYVYVDGKHFATAIIGLDAKVRNIIFHVKDSLNYLPLDEKMIKIKELDIEESCNCDWSM